MGAPPQSEEPAGNVSAPLTGWRASQEESIRVLVNIYFKTFIYFY